MTTVDEIFTQKIPAKLEKNPDLASSIDATFVFDLTGEQASQWTLDLTKPGGEVKPGAIENPNLTVIMKGEDLAKIVDGSLKPEMAFMTGKLKIKGDMPLALKLQNILG